jgi:aryl-alcohol dehydrogenase-like predicted oxidoreductase
VMWEPQHMGRMAPHTAEETRRNMYYRPLGKTGVLVSEVGMGCNRLGQDYAPDEHWAQLVRQAADLGVTVFDSSESYGWGRSEEMLGRGLGGREDVLIATKVSRNRGGDPRDFSAERVIAAAEASLRRLQRDRIDIYQLHSPSRADLERFDWATGMVRLKEQGKIRFSGVAVNSAADGAWLIENAEVDVLQITYNIFVTDAEEGLFGLALEHGVGLLCRMPLARGVLTGKFRPGEGIGPGHRAALDGERAAENVCKAEMLRPVAESYPGGMTRLAHHFCLTPRAISAIIPGARTVAQVEENVSASNWRGLSAETRRLIRQARQSWGP